MVGKCGNSEKLAKEAIKDGIYHEIPHPKKKGVTVYLREGFKRTEAIGRSKVVSGKGQRDADEQDWQRLRENVHTPIGAWGMARTQGLANSSRAKPISNLQTRATVIKVE